MELRYALTITTQKDHILSHYEELVQYDGTRSYLDLPAIQLLGKSFALRDRSAYQKIDQTTWLLYT